LSVNHATGMIPSVWLLERGREGEETGFDMHQG